MEEIDIWRSADILIKQHGDKAAEVAGARMLEHSQKGDGDGATAWVQIMLAIRELQKDKPSASEPMN